MKVICSVLFSFCILSLKLYASLPVSAHFCLINETGDVPVTCTGPALTKENLSYFKDLYTEVIENRFLPTLTSRIFHPLMVQSTSQSANQILKEADLKKISLHANTHQINLTRLPQWTVFGGSVSEGQILIPDRNQIHIARKFGRMILGTLFLSPDCYGGSALQTQSEYLLDPEKNDSVVENFLDLAILYGFDGYFINPESTYASENQKAFGAFMEKLTTLANSKNYPLHLEWYVVGAEDFTDTVINPTDGKISGGIFVDHGAWGDAKSAWEGLTPEEKSSYNPFEFKYGAYGLGDLPVILSDYDLGNSISYFQFNSVINPEQLCFRDPASQDNNERFFWVQNEASFPPYPIKYSIPFYTNFSTGRGLDLFREGSPLQFGPWDSIGLLNPLPDLALILTQVNFDYSVVYEGGNSLRIDLEQKYNRTSFCCRKKKLKEQNIPLYTNLNLQIKGKALEANLTYFLPQKESSLKLCINEDDSCCFTLSPSPSWQKISLPINQNGTCDLTQIDTLFLTYTETNEDSSLYLGEFYIEEPQVFAKLVQFPEASLTIKNSLGGSVLTWQVDPKALFYDLYLRGTFMGATPLNSFWFEDETLSKNDTRVVPVYPGSHPSLEGQKNIKIEILEPEKVF